MTYTENIKKIASKDGITPDFAILSIYTNFNEDQFYKKYLFYKNQGVFIKATKIAKTYKLDKYTNELFFFLIEIAEKRAETKWARDVAKSREDAKYLKQIQKLHAFCAEIQTHGGYKKPEKTKDPTVKKINFITDKKLLAIDSHKLCVVIINLIEEHYYKNRLKISEDLSKITNLNPKQYDKQFVLGLKPIIKFLDKETIRWSSKNKIYEFISDFLDVLGIDITRERIKDALKAKQQ